MTSEPGILFATFQVRTAGGFAVCVSTRNDKPQPDSSEAVEIHVRRQDTSGITMRRGVGANGMSLGLVFADSLVSRLYIRIIARTQSFHQTFNTNNGMFIEYIFLSLFTFFSSSSPDESQP